MTDDWWRNKRRALLEIGATESSAYVYDLDTVRAACGRLTSLGSIDRVFYAIKANPHREVLAAVDQSGVNFEVVSPGELQHVLDVFPDIDRRRIPFAPNFAPRREYEVGAAAGVRMTLDNAFPLREWGEIFRGQEIYLRLDPGQGRGHHEHVRTAGMHSKFGIPLSELDEVRRLAVEFGATVVGLHAHVGSGILQVDNWRDIAETLLNVAADFADVRSLNLGGGLGVPQEPGQEALGMGALDAGLAPLRQRNPEYELWLEPGRYIAAEAGVLLATVTQTKGKGDVRYVGVTTGMNSMIRPALYGAYHEIVNLTRIDEPADRLVNVVGPICETGDTLGTERLLPRCREGDILLVAHAGAYGHVMGSGYNLRPVAKELAI